MRLVYFQKFCIVSLTLVMSVPVFAAELNDAAKKAAKDNNAKVLSAKTVTKGGGKTHEIKLLTNKGVVKTVKVPDSSKKKKKKD